MTLSQTVAKTHDNRRSLLLTGKPGTNGGEAVPIIAADAYRRTMDSVS